MYILNVYKDNKKIRSKSVKVGIPISIGRHKLNNIQLPDDDQVSRFHAALFSDDTGFFLIQDLGSWTNTYVKGVKNNSGEVKIGDHIQIGQYVLVLEHALSSIDKMENIFYHDDTKSISKTEINQNEIQTHHSTSSIKTKSKTEENATPSDIEFFNSFLKLQLFSADLYKSLEQMVIALYRWLHQKGVYIAIVKENTDEIEVFIEAKSEDEDNMPTDRSVKFIIDAEDIVNEELIVYDKIKEVGEILRSEKKIGKESIICVPLICDNNRKGFIAIEPREENYFELIEKQETIKLIAKEISCFLEKRLNFKSNQVKDQATNKIKIDLSQIIGISESIIKVISDVELASKNDASVLITGETGTGKELVAKAIHYNSLRKDKIILPINCGAIPEGILESELFGHKKGSFTGSIEDRKGYFEVADGGTLFLDEIGELPINLQVKLLRVIGEEREYYPVGSHKPVKANVRIIAATNKDLEKKIEEKEFRQDLYSRLEGFPIHIPPLRERKNDIPLLAGYFLIYFRQKHDKHIDRLSHDIIDLLMQHSWPGNIRELQNVIERAVIRANPAEECSFEVFTEKIKIPRTYKEDNKTPLPKKLSHSKLETVKISYIKSVFEDVDHNVDKAVKILGISRQTMYNYINKWGTDSEENLDENNSNENQRG